MTAQERTRIMDRLAKMKALADGGVGGERENAARLLEEVARKYGVDLSALDGAEVEKRHDFKIANGWRRDLFVQLVLLLRLERYGSLDVDHLQFYRWKLGPKCKGEFVKCTDPEWLEIMAKYTVLERDYQRQLKVFYRAFLEANDLLANCKPQRTPTKEEMQDAIRARCMALGIEKSQLRKQIEGEA